MDLQLDGKRALVTGGSRGIGKAVAKLLADEGCRVAIAARTKDTLEAAADQLTTSAGRPVLPITVDTGDDESVRAMVEAAVAGLGGVDILVNSAAKPMGQSA